MLSALSGHSGGGDFWAALAGFLLIFILVMAVFVILLIVSFWKIFTKAGYPGWAAIIPFYNNYILVQVARLPIYYFIVLVVPTLLAFAKVKVPSPGDTIISLVAFIVYAIVVYNVAKQFGKGIGYTVGLVLLPFIFYPMLAFGDSVYQGGDEVQGEDVQAHNDSPLVNQQPAQPAQVPEAPQTGGQTPTA